MNSFVTVVVFIHTFLQDKISDQVPQDSTQLSKSLNLTERRIKYHTITLKSGSAIVINLVHDINKQNKDLNCGIYPVLFTYLLTPLSRVCLEKLTGFQLVKLPHILWNLKAHYHSHKCLPPVPVLSHLVPFHTPTSHFLKIHLNIILPSMPGSPKWSLSFIFPHQNPVYASPLPHTCYIPRPSHSSRFYHLKNIG